MQIKLVTVEIRPSMLSGTVNMNPPAPEAERGAVRADLVRIR